MPTKYKFPRKPRKQTRKKTEPISMNCSPIVAANKASPNTCYTMEMLELIRASYNQNHSAHEYIPWSNPDEIWRTLNRRLVNCEKEDCWLAEIKDAELRKQIDTLIFAPDQPAEWKTNKNEWLTDIDIRKVMHQYEQAHANFKFIGPSPINYDTMVPANELYTYKGPPSTEKMCVWEELCHINLKSLLHKKIDKIGMVFNLDRHNMPGSHWVSLFVCLDKAHPFVFYFDSGGKPPPHEIQRLMKTIKTQGRKAGIAIKSHTNTNRQHQKGNTECGMYSLFFIVTMLTGDSGFEQNMPMKKRISLFKTANIPDKYVEEYRSKYYNK